MERIDADGSPWPARRSQRTASEGVSGARSSLQHMYLAVVSARLGETTAAANEWYRALDTARSPGLDRTSAYAEKNGVLGNCRCGLCAF